MAERLDRAALPVRRDAGPRSFFPHVRPCGHPRSRSRAAYWAGRACETLGQGDEAVRWFNLAAQNVTPSMAVGGQPHPSGPVADAAARPSPSQADIAQFEHQEMTQAAHLLGQIKETDLVRPFMLRPSIWRRPRRTRTGRQSCPVAGPPDIAVTVAKQSERQGVR